MSKKKLDSKSLVDLELSKLEKKVQEFQTYLEQNSILKAKTLDSTDDYQDKLHKEMLVQIKVQDALFNWMPLLAKLRETEEDKVELRGGGELNGMYINKKQNG